MSSFRQGESIPFPIICKSAWYKVNADTLVIDYAGEGKNRPGHQLYIGVQQLGVDDTIVFAPPDDPAEPKTWKAAEISLSRSMLLAEIRFVIVDKTGNSDWIALRNRVALYSSNAFANNLWHEIKRFELAILWLSAISLACFGYFVVAKTSSNLGLFACFFIASIFVHFRIDPYFRVDDWFLLKSLSTDPFRIFQAHNEHFVPLFKFLTYLEHSIFGIHYQFYLLLSLVFHAFNCLLLVRLLQTLLPADLTNRTSSVLLGFLFLIIGLHAEILQWAVCQAILLALSAMLASFLAACYFLNSGQTKALLICAFFLFIAPLCYGAGILAPVGLVVLIPIWQLIAKENSAITNVVSQRRKQVLALAASLFIINCLIYFRYSSGEGHSYQLTAFQSELPLILLFVVNAAFFGTIAAGSGFAQFEGQHLIPRGLKALQLEAIHPAPAVHATVIGVVLAALLLFYYLRKQEFRTHSLYCWLIGLALVFLPHSLIAVGRSHFSILQALSFRYQMIPLVGLCVLVAPLIFDLVRGNRRSSGELKQFAMAIVLVCFCFSQLAINTEYSPSSMKCPESWKSVLGGLCHASSMTNNKYTHPQ